MGSGSTRGSVVQAAPLASTWKKKKNQNRDKFGQLEALNSFTHILEPSSQFGVRVVFFFHLSVFQCLRIEMQTAGRWALLCHFAVEFRSWFEGWLVLKGSFSQGNSDRMRGNGLRLCQGGLGWILGKHSLEEWVNFGVTSPGNVQKMSRCGILGYDFVGMGVPGQKLGSDLEDLFQP